MPSIHEFLHHHRNYLTSLGSSVYLCSTLDHQRHPLFSSGSSASPLFNIGSSTTSLVQPWIINSLSCSTLDHYTHLWFSPELFDTFWRHPRQPSASRTAYSLQLSCPTRAISRYTPPCAPSIELMRIHVTPTPHVHILFDCSCRTFSSTSSLSCSSYSTCFQAIAMLELLPFPHEQLPAPAQFSSAMPPQFLDHY
jgi:hypothetical protein